MKRFRKILMTSVILVCTFATMQATDITLCKSDNLSAINNNAPTTILLDTISGGNVNFDLWVIQLKPDPFLDGIRIKSTQKDISFDWILKTLDGKELGSKIENRREAKLDCRFLPKGIYVLELRTVTETSSVQLVKY